MSTVAIKTVRVTAEPHVTPWNEIDPQLVHLEVAVLLEEAVLPVVKVIVFERDDTLSLLERIMQEVTAQLEAALNAS